MVFRAEKLGVARAWRAGKALGSNACSSHSAMPAVGRNRYGSGARHLGAPRTDLAGEVLARRRKAD
jgi:hypothetical protein